MRRYYIDESEGPRYYVRSALGVDAERWNDLAHDIREWQTSSLALTCGMSSAIVMIPTGNSH